MKTVTFKLQKFNPETNNGWHFDFNFLSQLSKKFGSSMEEIDDLLNYLCENNIYKLDSE